MSRSTLTALSEELRVSIVNYISLPADLKNLRLTCCEIEPLATARFYLETTVDLWKWSPRNPMYYKGYKAHPCIRYVSFKANLSNCDGLVSKMFQSRVELKDEVFTKMNLSRLVMQDVHFYYADRTITHYVDFGRLSSLDLFTCPGVAKLLGKNSTNEPLVPSYIS